MNDLAPFQLVGFMIGNFSHSFITPLQEEAGKFQFNLISGGVGGPFRLLLFELQFMLPFLVRIWLVASHIALLHFVFIPRKMRYN
jgi:hypothetical protein